MYPEQNLSRIPNPVSKVAESKISKSYSPKHKYTPSLIELVVGTLKCDINTDEEEFSRFAPVQAGCRLACTRTPSLGLYKRFEVSCL